MKILVIAPHPDDEVLGCGGTLAKHCKQGDEIYLIIATKGYTPDWTKEYLEIRKKEIENVKKILGIKKIFFLNYPTVKLDTIPQKEINDALYKIVNQVKPDIVYIPFKGDLNKDHRILFEASLVALRPINHKCKKILAYEVLSETEWGQEIEIFKPNVYVDITDTIDIKLEAMKAYKSELKSFPHPRSLEAIKALAIKRGSEIGVKYAESFYLVREIIK